RAHPWLRGLPCANTGVGAGWGQALAERCRARVPSLTAHSPAQLPYVPHVSPMALLGKVTATTFALERPRCIFDGHADASDAIWLAVAFANATFRNPQSRADVPPYKQLPTARSYMTLETAAAAYSCSSCSAPSPPVLRVGGDTACRDRGRQDPCNGPLPSPGPYRVKFLLMGCRGPKAETRWSDPILLRTGTRGTATPPARQDTLEPEGVGQLCPPILVPPPVSLASSTWVLWESCTGVFPFPGGIMGCLCFLFS
uniref:Uroplakin 3B n=1 Tax=Malurus cyaneus samueli TaxID=2593467 RepID=A0A8C5T8F7_9PASS